MILKKQTTMRILITGGAGFIGSRLANQLAQQGHYVRVIDDLSSGDPGRLNANINFNRGDVRDVPKLWSLLHGIDVVYHLAARVSVPASQLYPREYNEVNVGGTVSLLEACRDVGIRRVVMGSSAAIYGNQTTHPVTEKTTPCPTNPYAVSKASAEQYLFNIARHNGFESVALRIFNAYGPAQPLPPTYPPVIPQFMHQVVGRGSVIIHGDGKQTRDFVYIDDVVNALISAGQVSNIDGQIINVGSGKEVSMNQLAHLIGETVGTEPNLLYNHEASGGTARLVGDLTLARQLLGYKPSTSLKAGLKKLYQQDSTFQSDANHNSQNILLTRSQLALVNC